jgi:ligand-binding sensor domain-containing protein
MRDPVQWSLAAILLGSCASQHTPQPGVSGVAVAGDPGHLRFEHGVRAILEDSKGNSWFGSWQEGVCRFDGKGYTYFTVNDGLCDNQVRRIIEDHKGVIWFETALGISSFDGEKIATHTRRNYASKDDWRIEPGDLWFKEDGSRGATVAEGRPGVVRYDGKTFTFLAYPLPEDRGEAAAYATTGLAQGKGGRLWFATYGAVIGFDGVGFTILDDACLGLDERTGLLHVRCVLEDSKGRLWIGNNGIGVVLVEGGTITHFTQARGVGRRDHRSGGQMNPQPGDAPEGSPSMHRVFAMGEDRDSNTWFGTIEQGAWRWDGESLRQFSDRDGLTVGDVLVIHTNRRGKLWVGGRGGVYEFDGETFHRVH